MCDFLNSKFVVERQNPKIRKTLIPKAEFHSQTPIFEWLTTELSTLLCHCVTSSESGPLTFRPFFCSRNAHIRPFCDAEFWQFQWLQSVVLLLALSVAGLYVLDVLYFPVCCSPSSFSRSVLSSLFIFEVILTENLIILICDTTVWNYTIAMEKPVLLWGLVLKFKVYQIMWPVTPVGEKSIYFAVEVRCPCVLLHFLWFVKWLQVQYFEIVVRIFRTSFKGKLKVGK